MLVLAQRLNTSVFLSMGTFYRCHDTDDGMMTCILEYICCTVFVYSNSTRNCNSAPFLPNLMGGLDADYQDMAKWKYLANATMLVRVDDSSLGQPASFRRRIDVILHLQYIC